MLIQFKVFFIIQLGMQLYVDQSDDLIVLTLAHLKLAFSMYAIMIGISVISLLYELTDLLFRTLKLK